MTLAALVQYSKTDGKQIKSALTSLTQIHNNQLDHYSDIFLL